MIIIKIFIYINLLYFLFGQTDVESQLYHIPPNPPSVGEAISFEVSIPADLDVMEAVFFYKMDDQKSYNEIEMDFMGNTCTATISSVPEGQKIEYFFIIKQQDGTEVAFQMQHTHLHPHLLSITSNPNLLHISIHKKLN